MLVLGYNLTRPLCKQGNRALKQTELLFCPALTKAGAGQKRNNHGKEVKQKRVAPSCDLNGVGIKIGWHLNHSSRLA